ncbi:hypothetical protein KY316_02920 [Candidatus Woesearchaeota archaeon]|nr:hypothetical protein [Candidatus Woesearchaeota archaeon]
MKLDNIRFQSINDLMFILNREIGDERVKPSSPEEVLKVMRNTERKITAHLYSIFPLRKEKTILDWARVSAQLHAAVDDKVYYCIGGSWSSGRREWHNHMIDAVLEDEKLRKQTPTAVVVTGYGKLISYYFYENYAFVNQDIDSNWHKGLRERLDKAGLPFTERKGEHGLYEIVLNEQGKETLLYRSMSIDFAHKRFYESLRKKD